MSWKSFFTKQKKEELDQGLEKTKKSFFSKIATTVAGKSKVDDEVLDNLEEVLVSSDVSVKTTLKIIERLEERVKKEKYVGVNELNNLLKNEIIEMLSRKHCLAHKENLFRREFMGKVNAKGIELNRKTLASELSKKTKQDLPSRLNPIYNDSLHYISKEGVLIENKDSKIEENQNSN